jgi:hypothetical protein
MWYISLIKLWKEIIIIFGEERRMWIEPNFLFNRRTIPSLTAWGFALELRTDVKVTRGKLTCQLGVQISIPSPIKIVHDFTIPINFGLFRSIEFYINFFLSKSRLIVMNFHLTRIYNIYTLLVFYWLNSMISVGNNFI